MKSMKKCIATKEKISKSIKLDKRRSNKRRSSAGMFYTSSAGAVTSLICFGNQKMLSRTRVAPARRHGRSALIRRYATSSTSGRNLRNVLYSIFLITLPVLLVHQAHATASTINISVVDNVSLSILPTSTSGTFATSDTSTNNISVRTTNGTGYTLGIKASTEGSNALNGANSTSIPSHTVSAGISEATYSTDPTYNNTWGYRPSKLNSTANSNYLPGPTSASTAITLDKTTSANPSTANNYNLAIGARVNDSTAPGAYSNVFVLTVTANPIPYTITYNKNTTDTVTNMPANTSSQTYDETVNISGLVPARDGFNFKGWCTVQVADGGTCTGTTYNPDGGGTNLTWTLNQTSSSNSLTLYAMWKNTRCEDTLYNCIATAWTNEGSRVMTNDDNANTGIQAAITTTNSGIFKYNPSTFGTASDAANTHDIYFYRGILDNTTGSYGSDGDNAAHPNTVVLSSASSKGNLTTSDTCWRIVRTTGSGGVKMIYQGKWTGSTCANATTAAQVTTNTFSVDSSKYYGSAFGYTQNGSYNSSNLSATYSTMFGSNTSYSANSTNSGIKAYIENTWFTNINSFASKLEPSAGYCNDRTLNSGTSWTTPMSDSTTVSTSTTYNAGAYIRNATATLPPSLTCPRGGADLYTTSSASNGNKQLSKPAALITADEASFAGSGRSTASQGSSYHANSFLRSGSSFWLLSPYNRDSGGFAGGFILPLNGALGGGPISLAYGVRPAISLKPGSIAVSGSGTATDPWIVDTSVSPNPYCTDASTCMQNTTSTKPACGTTMTDGRDGATYTTATIAGTCWMTQNLRFTGGELKVGESDVTSDTTISYGQLTDGNSYTEPRIATGSTTDYGTYYNYCAASAGEVCNDTTRQDATRSVCPAGWKLPTQAQLNAVPSKDSHFTASSGLAGTYIGGSLDYAGTYVLWWASTANSATHQYLLLYGTDFGGFWSVSNSQKYCGYSVRCVRAS